MIIELIKLEWLVPVLRVAWNLGAIAVRSLGILLVGCGCNGWCDDTGVNHPGFLFAGWLRGTFEKSRLMPFDSFAFSSSSKNPEGNSPGATSVMCACVCMYTCMCMCMSILRALSANADMHIVSCVTH